MTDLYAFRALRAPRRTEAVDDFTLITEWSEIDSSIHTHVQRWQWGGTEFLPQLRDLVANAENPSGQAPDLAVAFLKRPDSEMDRTKPPTCWQAATPRGFARVGAKQTGRLNVKAGTPVKVSQYVKYRPVKGSKAGRYPFVVTVKYEYSLESGAEAVAVIDVSPTGQVIFNLDR